MSEMDTKKWEILAYLSKTESVRKTAELAQITPSTVSKVVRQLEESCGCKLLVPAGRGIALTAEAREWLLRVTPILTLVQDLEHWGIQRKERANDIPLRLTSFEVFSTHFLQLLESSPDFNRGLVLHESMPGDLEHAIDSDQADLGITYIPMPHPRINHVRIADAKMAIFKRKGSFIDRRVEDIPFVVPVEPIAGAPNQIRGLDAWPAGFPERQIHARVTLMESAIELVRQGRCAAYLPEFVVRLHNKRVSDQYRLEPHPFKGSLPSRVSTPIYIARRKMREEDADFKRVARWIRLAVRGTGE